MVSYLRNPECHEKQPLTRKIVALMVVSVHVRLFSAAGKHVYVYSMVSSVSHVG
jgi:hypothetical protein